jgi:hypothetical protein
MPTLSLRLIGLIGTGFLVLLLVGALLATRATLSETKRQRDEAELKLSVSNASLNSIQKEMARMVAEQKALANSDANRINASRQSIQIVNAVAKVREAAIDKLNASAGLIRSEDTAGKCDASATLLGEWPA